MREWAVLACKGWLLLSGSVVLASLKAAVKVHKILVAAGLDRALNDALQWHGRGSILEPVGLDIVVRICY